jgi:cation:H+ antiporter
MLASLAIFLQQSVKGSIPLPALNEVTEELDDLPKENHSYLRIAGLIGFGVLALPFGADLVVDAGSTLAASLGVSESVIGLSVFALGTSLPELASTTVAAVYRNSDVALGNVLGSNLFNILAVLGVTLMLTDIPVDEAFLRLDIWVMMGCATLLWLYCIVGASIGRVSGIFFLVGYVAYISSLFTG